MGATPGFPHMSPKQAKNRSLSLTLWKSPLCSSSCSACAMLSTTALPAFSLSELATLTIVAANGILNGCSTTLRRTPVSLYPSPPMMWYGSQEKNLQIV